MNGLTLNRDNAGRKALVPAGGPGQPKISRLFTEMPSEFPSLPAGLSAVKAVSQKHLRMKAEFEKAVGQISANQSDQQAVLKFTFEANILAERIRDWAKTTGEIEPLLSLPPLSKEAVSSAAAELCKQRFKNPAIGTILNGIELFKDEPALVRALISVSEKKNFGIMPKLWDFAFEFGILKIEPEGFFGTGNEETELSLRKGDRQTGSFPELARYLLDHAD